MESNFWALAKLGAVTVQVGLLAAVAFGADLHGLQIKTSFEYEAGEKPYKTSTTIAIDDKNKAWMTLAPPQKGVTLLGRLAAISDKTIELEYIVVDTKLGNPIVVTPVIKGVLGERANLVIKEPKNEKITISLLANRFTLTTVK